MLLLLHQVSSEIADDVYNILHAFAKIGRPAPEPKGIIDSLVLLRERFGRRAGNMKMATLANYFGLGDQTHRSLDDVRMNLEVLKYCAKGVVFWYSPNLANNKESSLPDILTTNSWVSPNATTRSPSNRLASQGERNLNSSSSLVMLGDDQEISPPNGRIADKVPIPVNCNTLKPDPFNMGPLIDQIKVEAVQSDASMEEVPPQDSPEIFSSQLHVRVAVAMLGFGP
ncbi:hypothetical protein IFM89_018665 [Coptis chinensis]|uniref:Exonuclease domain-containing protein n=1 Tax=Coptis chinensis TaxID=261450 RepID=A0A835I1Z3_9MAGN|nr:hypothetical protein IFM89_018665 [Coptis chinensis]